MTRPHGVPMARGMTPAGDTVNGRRHEAFAGPTLGAYFLGPVAGWQFSVDAMEPGLPIVMPLQTDRRLVVRVTFRLLCKRGEEHALRTGRLFGMNPDRKYQAALRD